MLNIYLIFCAIRSIITSNKPYVTQPNGETMTSQTLCAKKVYIETLGCQMNVNDSELMLGLLEQQGFSVTYTPQDADLLIINTCQIRGHAEDKAYSYLGKWSILKKHRPHIKIAMAGCVAQQAKDSVFKRIPNVDFVFGTQNIHDLPELAARAFAGDTHFTKTDRQKTHSTYDFTLDVAPIRENKTSAWVTIIEGCDYFCTYCVVPYTRGRQISRPAESILDEVKQLAVFGYKEITLLGQTVDSYGKDFKHNDALGRRYDLADLMTELNEINGLERIRFSTSHPLDLNDRIIDAVVSLPKVMEHIHIPMQSGDTEVLSRMNRGYSAEEFYTLVDKIVDRVPDVMISGDYIVGFPGETEAQFQRTLDSVSRSHLGSANTAAYSARQQTPAGIWEERGEGVISDKVKRDRLQRLNAAVTQQATKMTAQYDGQTVEILVEGPSRRNPDRLTGRTRNNRVVNFTSPWPAEQLIGTLVNVVVTEPQGFSMIAEHRPTEKNHLPKDSKPISTTEPALVS